MLHEAAILSLLAYEPETGALTWKRKPNRRITIGSIAGRVDGYGYVNVKVDGKLHKAHRIAFLLMEGAFPKERVDHINGDRSDNRWCNIRHASPSENSQNISGPTAKNTSGFLGVTRGLRGKGWIAQIVVNKRRHHLGTFEDPQAAHHAYIAAKKRLHKFQPTIRKNVITDQRAA